MLTLGLGVLFVAWQVAAWLIYAATLGVNPPSGMSEFFSRLFTTPEGWAMIVVGNLVGFVFAALTLVLTVVSFPMVVDRPVEADRAISASISAVSRNPTMIARWGLRVAGLLALGCLPLFLGLPIILPVLGYATWHLYTRLIAR